MSAVTLVSLEDCSLVPLMEKYLGLIRAWRNSDRIRHVMFSDHIISEEEHRRWFASLQNDPSKDYQIFMHRHKPLGLSCFTHIDRIAKKSEWGFYTSPDDSYKGLGTALGYLALKRAFQSLDVSMVYTYTFAFNTRALRLQEKLGFLSRAGDIRRATKDGFDQDVKCLELTRNRWSEVLANLDLQNLKGQYSR